MTKFYIHKITDECISSVTLTQRSVDLSEYIELVRCADGILRDIDSVNTNDRFVYPKELGFDPDAE